MSETNILEALSKLEKFQEKLDSAIKAATSWQRIETAPLGEMVLLWHPLWRHPFPGQPNGKNGMVWIDTCETEARGRQDTAQYWMPLPPPPVHNSPSPDTPA